MTVVFIGSARSSLGLDSSQVREPWASRFGYSGGGDKNVSRFRSQNQCWRMLPRTSKFLSFRSKCCYSSVPLHWGRRGWWCPTAWTIKHCSVTFDKQAKQAGGGEVAKENRKRSPIITGWKTSQGDTQRGVKASKIVIKFCQNFVFYHIWHYKLYVCLCHNKHVSCVLLDKQAMSLSVRVFAFMCLCLSEMCVWLGTYHKGAREKSKAMNSTRQCFDHMDDTDFQKIDFELGIRLEVKS